jgi:hypothetical protein
MRDLRQDAGAVAGARVGADRAAVLEVAQDGERVRDQLLRLAALDVGDEADAAGILVERRSAMPESPPDRAWRKSLAAPFCLALMPVLASRGRPRRRSELPLWPSGGIVQCRCNLAPPARASDALRPEVKQPVPGGNWDSNTVLTYLCKF